MAEVVAHLRESKELGCPWEEARLAAVRGTRIPWNIAASPTPTLFDETGRDTHKDTVAAFFWRVAEKAYNDYVGPKESGDGPALRHFACDLADDDVRLDPVMAA